jgi:hypothetical protein
MNPTNLPRPNDLVKIRFQLKPGEWEGLEAENVWAEPVKPNEYRIANVPFYVYGVSAEDTVHAAPLDGVMTFTGIAQRGGHSTYRLLLQGDSSSEDPQFLKYWKPLENIGCTFEVGNRKWLAVDVPESTNIYDAYSLFENGEKDGIWSFDEGHCGHPVKAAGTDENS